MTCSWRQVFVLAGRWLKRLIEFCVFFIFDVVALIGARVSVKQDSVVIVHVQLLGDYVIWVPFARAMMRHFICQGGPVTFVVNSAVEALAQKHLVGASLVFVDRSRLVRDWRYRYMMLRRLRRIGASRVIHDSAPRDGCCSDALIGALSARECWGYSVEYSDRPWVDRVVRRRQYTRLISVDGSMNQVEIHRQMIKAVGIRNDEVAPQNDFSLDLLSPCSGRYVLVVPGASVSTKRWPAARFAGVVSKVLAAWPDCYCVVVGTGLERDICDEIVRRVGGMARSLAGEVSLQEFVGLIANARVVLGNDSAAGHIAAAAGVPSLIVAGGGHFGHCFPCPTDSPVHAIPCVVAHEMPCFGCGGICRWSVNPGEVFPCLDAVSIEDVAFQLSIMIEETEMAWREKMANLL